MKEIIIYSNYNEAELFRTLAKYGKNLFGYRVLNTKELVEYCLNQVGETSPKCISQEEQISFIYSQNWNEKELGKKSYQTCVNIANTINTLRSLIINVKDFDTDKKALSDLFFKYDEYLNMNKLYDDNRLINLVINKEIKIDNEVVLFKHEEHTFIEDELIKQVFSNVNKIDVSYLAQQENNNENITYSTCISKKSEILKAFKIINTKGYNLDQCLIILADPTYANETYNICHQLDISYTSLFGKPLSESNTIKIFKMYRDWDVTNFNNIDSLRRMIKSSQFNSLLLFGEDHFEDADFIIKELGNLKISTNKAKNDYKVKDYEDLVSDSVYYEKNLCSTFGLKTFNKDQNHEYLAYLKNIIKQLELPLIDFLNRYTISGEDGIDEEAIKHIKGFLEKIEKYDLSISQQNPLVKELYNTRVLKTMSKEKSICITDISHAFQSIRKYVFILGLSSDVLPREYVENSLFLDSDFELLDPSLKQYLPVKENYLDEQKKRYDQLIKILTNFSSILHLSYPIYDIAAVEDKNPSSVIFGKPGIYDHIDIDDKHIIFDSFESMLLPQDKYFSDCLKGNIHESKEEEFDEVVVSNDKLIPKDSLKSYSPSAIHAYFECPFKFFANYFFGINPDDEDDPFDLIKANEYGTLIHSCMEKLIDKISKEEFMKNAKKEFDDFFKRNPPISDDEVKQSANTKNLFLKCVENGFDKLHDKNIVSVEEEIIGKFPNKGLKTCPKIIIKGRPDCIYEENGKYVIVDFKTGSKIKHINNDAKTCMQALFYAYCFELTHEAEAAEVDRVEYHYLKHNAIVSCKWDNATRDVIYNILNAFISGLENNYFLPRSTINTRKKDPDLTRGEIKKYLFPKYCEFCKIKDLCSVKTGVDTEDGD